MIRVTRFWVALFLFPIFDKDEVSEYCKSKTKGGKMEKKEKVKILLHQLIKGKIISSFCISDSNYNKTTICLNLIFEHESKILKRKCKLNYGFSWDLLNNKFFCGHDVGNLFVEEADLIDFVKNKVIPSRVKGFSNEERLYVFARQLGKITENIRISKIFMGSEHADEKLKVDMWLQLIYSSKGKFDSLIFSHTTMIGIQVKSSSEAQIKHRQKHPHIPSIVVNTQMSDSYLEKRFVSLMKNIVRFKAAQLYAMTLADMDTAEHIVQYTNRGIVDNYEKLHL